MAKRLGWLWMGVVVLVVSVLAPSASAARSPTGTHEGARSGSVTIRVLSTRSDLVSGGTALVGVFLPAGVDPATARVTLGGKDITGEFGARRVAGLMNGVPAHNLIGIDDSANALIGSVTGLGVGANVLTARLPNGSGARLTVTNHPSGGPIFSGPQIQPWTCNPGASDARCDRQPTYQFFYVPAGANRGPQAPNVQTPDPRFQSYDPSHPPPSAAIAPTTTDGGRTVPFIVGSRRDRGPGAVPDRRAVRPGEVMVALAAADRLGSQVAVYAGFPVSWNGLATAKTIFDAGAGDP